MSATTYSDMICSDVVVVVGGGRVRHHDNIGRGRMETCVLASEAPKGTCRGLTGSSGGLKGDRFMLVVGMRASFCEKGI